MFPGQILKTKEGVPVYPEQVQSAKETEKTQKKAAKESSAAKKEVEADSSAEVIPSAKDALF